MQAGGLLAYRSKFCWLEVICCACQSNELKREIMKKNLGAKNLGGAWSNRPPPRIATAVSRKFCWLPIFYCHLNGREYINIQKFTGPDKLSWDINSTNKPKLFTT